MQAQREAPPDMQCKDKFLVQSVVVPEGFKEQDITQELFNKESGKEVLETKLRVIYVAPPRPPSPVHEEPAEEAIQAGDMDSIDQAFYDSGKGLNELKLKLEEKKSQIAKLTEEKKAALQKTQQLQQEIASLRANSGGKMAFEQKTASGYSFLFILIVGLVGISLGYFLRS
ncbi:hypothetical protein KP509_39G059000 [Ceratopteris richardii]|nr:hypothetical protein KP509_39G059000 [Ceratopteris richardii]